ncbi:hypothetical protein [Xanthobacter sp. KR7-225]|uniref:hypothetical protein n=1 Tax=Xanthobacter sp. KR7-225 TaxID=3156613 RepID=UPI0032B33A1B
MNLSKIGRLGLIARNQPATLHAGRQHHSWARKSNAEVRHKPGCAVHVGRVRGRSDVMIAYAPNRLVCRLLGPQNYRLIGERMKSPFDTTVANYPAFAPCVDGSREAV